MKLDMVTANKIRDCLIGVIDPASIVVFGSYARGEAGADSDIDIAAITSGPKATREKLIQSRLALREALKGSGLAIDFILQSAEQFDSARKQRGSIQEAIATEGQVIYERQ
jgi:predicted nucleotidyltransferase